jgi:hypothetical protein
VKIHHEPPGCCQVIREPSLNLIITRCNAVQPEWLITGGGLAGVTVIPKHWEFVLGNVVE